MLPSEGLEQLVQLFHTNELLENIRAGPPLPLHMTQPRDPSPELAHAVWTSSLQKR